MNLSYWEQKTWLSNIEFAVIGSGIVGLTCALQLRKKYPHAKIVVFEKGMLPSGASTKNAGFACFGSLSEILEDLKTHSQDEVVSLVEQRKNGLNQLRELLGEDALNYKPYGGYELFTHNEKETYQQSLANIEYINNLLRPIFKDDVFSKTKNNFRFKNIESSLIFNRFEGQIDTGKMMLALLSLVNKNNIIVLNNARVTSVLDTKNKVVFQLNNLIESSASKVFIATNGFAKQFINYDVKPARAQVLITKSIPNLHIKGTFHIDKGYYYFRNIANRILLGGGRNLDFKTEETTKQGLTPLVQDKLKTLLQTVLLPDTPFEIDMRWSGIMGVGKTKNPILKPLSENVFCGVRLGGMGVAIGTHTGKELANIL